MKVVDHPTLVSFRRRTLMRYFEHKLRTYGLWRDALPLRTKAITPEELYVKIQRKLQALGEEEDKSARDESAESSEQADRHIRIRMQQQTGDKRAWGDMLHLPLLALIQDHLIPYCGPPLNGLEQQIA